MKKFRFGLLDRMLAILLSLLVVVSTLPTTIFAANETKATGYTINVVDENNNGLDQVTIDYEIFVDGASDTSGSVKTSNGKAIIEELKNYEAMPGKTIALSYDILLKGYERNTGKNVVTDFHYTLTVTMKEEKIPTAIITVQKTGNGSVKINGADVTNSEFVINTPLSFTVTPDSVTNGYPYIKSLKIDGKEVAVEKYQSYSNENFKIQGDTKIEVVFSTDYEVSATYNTGGKVIINDQENTTQRIEAGNKASIQVTPDEGYQVGAFKLNGVEQSLTDEQILGFEQDLTMNENKTIDVAFVKMYTVEVNYDTQNGSVTTDPENIGGSVSVKEGTEIEIKAIPNANYRVASVIKNGEITTYDENDLPFMEVIQDIDQDWTYEITFALNTYSVSVNTPTHGKVTLDQTTVNYGEQADLTIQPDAGYVLDTVSVNQVQVEPKRVDEDTLLLSLENITEDQVTEVTFKEMPKANLNDVSFNENDAVRHEGNLYVFQKNQSVIFTTTKEGIRINGTHMGTSHTSKEVAFNASTTVSSIELFYKDAQEPRADWHKVEVAKDGIQIVIDQIEPTVSLTLDQPNKQGYYHTNVNGTIETTDPDVYSGIASVEYWVTSDGNETQHELLTKEHAQSYKDQIQIDAVLNNSDNVQIKVQVTDTAGNSKMITKEIKINKDQPKVSIQMDGTLASGANVGTYNIKRTATIVVEERASTFDKDAATKGITIRKDGTLVTNKHAMVGPWHTDGNMHTATIQFVDDGAYSWQFTYTNHADMSNGEIVTTGDSIYEFTIDTLAPTGYIEMEQSIWNKIVEKITFGLWRNHSMSAEATGTDATTAVKEISYFKTFSTAVLSEAELSAHAQQGDFQTAPFVIEEDEHFVIYARLMDEAGNVSYISTNGAIVDQTPSKITLTPDQANEFGYYHEDVKVGIQVDEMDGTRSYSGIKEVRYRVENLQKVTQEGTLYTFEGQDPTLDQLTETFKDEIIVDCTKNNSDDVQVIVTTTDNAGNENEERLPLKINLDAPTIDVTFNDQANRVENDNGYFPHARTATITIHDRATTFHKENAIKGIHVEGKDANQKDVALNVSDMLSTWEHNGNEHSATITFAQDANYTWNLTYTNKADVQVKDAIHYTGNTPTTFTVDQTTPFGSLTVEEDTNTFFRFLQELIIGGFPNDEIAVSATGGDATSPIEIFYFKTDQATPITVEELAKKEFVPFEPFKVIKDEQVFVYLRINDYAGNTIYINSDGYILDQTQSNLSYELTGINANGIAHDDVLVKVHATDPAPYSGIASLEYWVEKDGEETQRETLFQFDVEQPTQAQLVQELNKEFSVDAQLNNSCNVVVYIKVVDNAGNEWMEGIPLDIDVIAPSIEVTYDNNKDHNGNSYFDQNRTATISITERTHHFDAQKATQGIQIQAVDAKGNKVNLDLNQMISEWTTTEGQTPDEAIHTATIAYVTDGNYTFDISYKDQADLENTVVDTKDSQAPYIFTVDKQAPTGSITGTSAEGRVTTWDSLIDQLSFGFWSGQKIKLTYTSNDTISPIESISYYKTSETTALSVTNLEKIQDWKKFTSFEVTPNEQFTVYVKMIDYAGNVAYISSDGMIVDDTAPREESIAPEITITPQQPINGFYHRDVPVTIKVDDPLVGNTYSGLQTVTYRVLNMGVETQSGTLYAFDNEKPSQSELLKSWSGSIIVDAQKNNSNDVVIEISAQDNALNASKDKVSIQIDVTAPTIEISYDNNDVDAGEYYQADRVAQITVTERNFNPEDVNIAITNTDGVIPELSAWSTKHGSGNLDDTTHTASIRYHADGDYTFSIDYSDLADNPCEKETYVEGTNNPTAFTMDQSAPEISVSYDNNEALNEKYFAANRQATVTITEHNFDRERVNFIITSTLDGAGIANPSITWNDQGDIHTATITYATDGDYVFDMTMLDLAGNENHEVSYGNSTAPKDFTIDTNIQEPTITGVEDHHSYKDDVIPVINFSDTNYESHEVKLTRTRMNEIGVDVTNDFITGVSVEAQGGNGSYDTFKKEQENDGIYTLYVKVVDKAGNNIDKSVTFTVNRYGSVYEFDDYLISLIQDGGAYVQQVENDFVITEYNADPLLEDSLSIELTKDGKPVLDAAINVNPVIDASAPIGDSGWYQYQYTINKSNFASDGVYKMAVASKDAAGNAPENMNYEDKEILFRVDHTTPEITSVTGMEEAIVNAQEVDVAYELYDTIGLKSLKIFVDDTQIDAVEDFSADPNQYQGTFKLLEKSSSQKVRLVVEDMAGNITDTDATEFSSAYPFEHTITVSTNLFVRWYANKPLFWGSILGVVGLGAALSYLIMKKKKETEEQA